MIQPGAGIRILVRRPAYGVHDEAGLVVLARYLPQLLDTQPVCLRIDPAPQVEPLHQLLAQRPAATFAEQRVGGPQLHARRVVILKLLG